jgi:3D (Asp-Asp-Asp) domain-containing protein
MRSTWTFLHRKDRPGAWRRTARRLALATVAGALLTTLLVPVASQARAISTSRKVTGMQLTEYFPVPEKWFRGKAVATPGFGGKHRVDWLYSARGVSMEGDGVSLNGTRMHIDNLGSAGWVNAAGRKYTFGHSSGSPFWRGAPLWKNSAGNVTFPLLRGGWSRGKAKKYARNRGITFASGPSRPLHYYQSIAVDPSFIKMKSRVYIPAYRKAAYNGWMCAVDTGSAIKGHHIDVYRPAPAQAFGSGYSLSGESVYVVPPGRHVAKGGPKMKRDPC